MLEVKNLSKVYASRKNGAETRALDGVTLCFPEKGMVFLLGKSGSGKSTLLNVCGGLDAPTEGEIIVKGRSSKSFSQSDFDSYRNTYVGFIFQEYNILNEFTVEDNIALALELQGKPKDKKAIADLLEQVDLTGFAKRKPNTLSGGQKQRIAIARALVKSPEIIMADEPTGALDSATGKQVFDTLKKLSQDKLVIVVSHDREFAELYADRIIELKDGKILTDVTKTQEKQEAISQNVTAIGDVLCIKQGSNLTDAEFDRIKSILRKNTGDVIIAGGERDVQNFKKVNRITADGEKEVFKDTDEDALETKTKKTYTAEQTKFIRSKLPARHAAKIGVSGLKTKPVRLFFTILLCVVSFVLFGVLSTLMLYNSEGMFKQTLKDSNYDYVVFDKVYRTQYSYYENGVAIHTGDGSATAKFSSADIDQIRQTFGEGSFGAISVNLQIPLRQSNSSYWRNTIMGASYLPETSFLRQRLTGSYPTANNEICVSTYVADMLAECKTTDKNGSLVSVSDRMDLIGKSIVIDGEEYKVTGIFDSGVIDSKYDALKDGTNQDYSIAWEFETLLNEGTHLLVGVSEDTLKKLNDRYQTNFSGFESADNQRGYASVVSDNAQTDEKGESNDGLLNSMAKYKALSGIGHSEYISLINGKTSLADNEAVVSFNLLYQGIWTQIYSERSDLDGVLNYLYNLEMQVNDINYLISADRERLDRVIYELEQLEDQVESLDPGYYQSEKDRLEQEKADYESNIQMRESEKAQLFSDSDKVIAVTAETFADTLAEYQNYSSRIDDLTRVLEIIGSGQRTIISEGAEPIYEELSVEERAELLRGVIEEYPDFVNALTLKFAISSQYNQSFLTEVSSYTVVGVVIPTNTPNVYKEDEVYLSDAVVDAFWEIQKVGTSFNEITSTYKDEEGAVYTKLYVPYDHSDKQTNYLWSVYSAEGYSADDSRIGLRGNYIDSLRMIDTMVVELSTIFFYVGLVLAVFATLLFSNFISVSISQKRREIGILRAVGARSLDVFKIFFSESLVIAIICSILSIAGSTILCKVLNAELGSALGASIFVFGLTSILIIFAIALLTAVLATFLPVWNAAKKKPVDSIRAI